MSATTPAFATITLVDVVGDSNSIDLTGSTPTIFGGVAGDSTVGQGRSGDCNNRVDSLTTCNNCYDNGAGDDSRLIACNPTRIFETVRLKITLSSDTVESGTPAITTSDDIKITLATTPSAVAKGSQGVIEVEWEDICDAIDTNSTAVGCEFAAGDGNSATFKVGIDKDGDGKLNSSGDDTKDVTITVHKGFVDDATAGDQSTMSEVDCSPAPDDFEGICRFDINPGDEKVQVREVQGAANFPSSTGIKFTNALFFFSSVGFANITPASPFVALPVETQDTDTFALSSDRVTGLENEVLYYFKAAVQDQAGNIGFFTADLANKTCASTNYEPPCHTAMPGAVTGVLAKDVNCFIATAAFGSPMANQVRTFRQFRNRFMLTNKLGRAFVRAYYKFGPTAARFIAQNEVYRAASRVALQPLLAYAWLSLKLGAWTALMLTAFVILGPFVWFIAQRRRRKSIRSNTHAA
ncbi:MAG: hypothetical protein NDI61_00925 [Bdellovibrionaceae bacterium]|nr:hypothetical protein [Pseudobdellovibrionaceae bacterium]